MKNPSRPQRYRIKRILEMVREGTRRGDLASAADFARDLEVHRNTIRQDLDCLRYDENAPIEYDSRRHGYVLTESTWDLPAFQISRSEVFALSVAAKVIEAFRGTPLETDMRSVMGKVQSALEGNITIDPAALTGGMSVLGEDYVRMDPTIWTMLARCVDRKDRVRMRYTRFDGATGDYVVDPYHLLAYHGDWYLIGHHHRRDAIASFAVSRIAAVESTGNRFEVPLRFDAAAWVRERFGVTGGERRLQVRLRFSPRVAEYIRRRIWHPSQQIMERRDGGLELRMTTTGWKEVVRWVLSWQPDVTVLAPKRLRERVEEKMREGLGMGAE